MVGIEALSDFFRFFEIIGLQNFSLKDLNEREQSKKSKILHGINAGFLVTLSSLLMISLALLVRPKSLHFKNVKELVQYVIGIGLSTALMVVTIVGVLETYFKADQFKKIIALTKQISVLCSAEFNFDVDYKKFARNLMKKFMIFVSIVVVVQIAIFVSMIVANVSIRAIALLLFPRIFMHSVMVIFNFYVELVNFQLNNLIEIVDSTIGRQKKLSKNRYHQNEALSMRQCYNFIFQMSQLTNHALRISVLIITLVLITTVITMTYENLVEKISGVQIFKRLSKLCVKRSD